MLRKFQSGLLLERLGASGGHDQSLGGVFQQDVVKLGMDSDRQIRGKSPGRGRPDHDRDRLVIGKTDGGGLVVIDGELHEDRGRGLLLILDLGLGKRGLRPGAPKDRLLAAVDESLLDHVPERTDDRGLIPGIQRQVGMLPVTENTQPAKLSALDVDKFAGVLLRLLADLQRREPGGGLHHAKLDRQTMAVPSRDERGLESGHRL